MKHTKQYSIKLTVFLFLLAGSSHLTLAQDAYLTEDGMEMTVNRRDSLEYNGYYVDFSILGPPRSFFYKLSKYKEEARYCGNESRMSFDEIKKLDTYRDATTIHVVSFKRIEVVDDSSRSWSLGNHSLPIANDTVNRKRLFENKRLNKKLQKELLNVLVNYDASATYSKMCYEPRNALLFIDRHEKVIGYIEICFGCSGNVHEPKTLQLGEFCAEKYAVLQYLFKEAGIQYGVNDEED